MIGMYVQAKKRPYLHGSVYPEWDSTKNASIVPNALAGLHLDVARRKKSEKAAQPRGLPRSGRSLPTPVGSHKDR